MCSKVCGILLENMHYSHPEKKCFAASHRYQGFVGNFMLKSSLGNIFNLATVQKLCM